MDIERIERVLDVAELSLAECVRAFEVRADANIIATAVDHAKSAMRSCGVLREEFYQPTRRAGESRDGGRPKDDAGTEPSESRRSEVVPASRVALTVEERGDIAMNWGHGKRGHDSAAGDGDTHDCERCAIDRLAESHAWLEAHVVHLGGPCDYSDKVKAVWGLHDKMRDERDLFRGLITQLDAAVERVQVALGLPPAGVDSWAMADRAKALLAERNDLRALVAELAEAVRNAWVEVGAHAMHHGEGFFADLLARARKAVGA